MTDALTSLDMSTGLRKVADRAKREPAARFHSLAHLIDEELLARAFARLRSDAAVGVDGITKDQYGQDLQSKLRDLHERLKTMRYRHQPIRRVHIPKEKKGQTRPIGISATEDKVVQSALREVLEAVYEQTFLDCSYGFRPGRSAHDAVRALTRAVNAGEANWIGDVVIVAPLLGRLVSPRSYASLRGQKLVTNSGVPPIYKAFFSVFGIDLHGNRSNQGSIIILFT